MKKAAYIFLALPLILAGLGACQQKEEPVPVDVVDLRYRVADSYDLDAMGAKPFTIVVKSNRPWTIRSFHPDWCIIEQEEGQAVADSLVHIGQGENTYVKVQYYDNLGLDDRIDTVEIASDGWIGKKVTVYQKGVAYLRVPEEEQEFMIEKAGGEVVFNIISNQPWTTKIIEIDGDWLSIAEGASGQLNGPVKLTAKENTEEKRYATVAVYDRLGEERVLIRITQDGVQLDPDSFEIRAGYDQLTAELHVISNTSWTAEKGGTEEWFSIDNPDGHFGEDVLRITLQDNAAGSSLRRSSIILKTQPANPGDAVAEKEIILKQAYPISPVRRLMDNDQMGAWSADWANPPVYTKDYGTLFAAPSRLHNSSMPFGTYTFHWKDWQGGARIRHWFCFDEGCELKVDIRPVDSKVSFDFNVASDGNKPSIDGFTDIDWSKPIEVTFKFDPSGTDYCHVTYLVNGVEAGSFDSSENLLCTVLWGTNVNMYVGCEQVSGQDPGSGVLEWFEYTAPINWDD